MGIQLKELISQVDGGSIRLVAGKNGYSNPVEWVHMVDSVEIADFLMGGEVAFTTGVGIQKGMTLLELVKKVYQKKASGMVINVGPYIPEITGEVITFGDEHDFPIFEVPWSVHMANIMKTFCFAINQLEKRELELSAAFKYAIFTPQQEELYIATLLQKGYLPEWNYVAAVVEICRSRKEERDRITYAPVTRQRGQILLKQTGNMVTRETENALVFPDSGRMIIVFGNQQESRAAKMADQVLKQLIPFLKKDETVFVSVGSKAEGIKRLSESYKMAKKIVALSKTEQREKVTRSYSDMGINRLLFHINDREGLERYYTDTIKPLEEYDALNDSNLVRILECYMDNDGSVQSTADALFVHRNTINYKLKKIESLMHVDLTKFSVRNELAAGLMAAKLRKCL